MTEFDLLWAVALSASSLVCAALGALWIARKDNVPHPPAGE